MFYNDYTFQSFHCPKANLIKSNINDLYHSGKLVYSSNESMSYLETPWGYSFPKTLNNLSLRDLWTEWSDYCLNKNIIAEIIKIPPFIKIESLDTSIFDELHVVSRTCALKQSCKSIEEYFDRKTRYKIRKASKVLTTRKGNESDIEGIYKLYNESMKKRNADKRFFLTKNTFSFLMRSEKSNFLLAFLGNDLISFVCFIFDNYNSHYHLAATNEIGRNFKANYLLLFLAIKESFNKKIKLIHFGGGLTSDENDNLFKFKSQFSNIILDYRIGLSIHNKILFNRYRDTSKNRILKLKNF